MRADALRAVREVYDAVGEHGSQAPRGMDLATGRELAAALGYPAEALAAIPSRLLDGFVGAAPVAPLAAPGPGQVIIDVGCGAGVDSFLAANAGARVIALDTSVPMLRRLQRGLNRRPPHPRLAAIRATAPHLPVGSGCADQAWLNGVANLVADRSALCTELGRVLRPGGRLLLADVFAREPVPEELRELPEAWAWCVAGAGAPEQWEKALLHSGFAEVTVAITEEFPPFCRGLLRATLRGATPD